MNINELTQLRRIHYRQAEGTHLHTDDDALDFINDLGFCWFINPSDADLPSLHHANPGPYKYKSFAENSRNAAIWWAWKQTLPKKKKCLYSKVLRGRGTFISWECFQFFYAIYATGNEYQEDYRAGILSRDEKRVLDLIAACPGISSTKLRKKFGPIGKPATRELNKALQSLQETFRITVCGGSLEGWTVHDWALVPDWVPAEYLDQTRQIDRVTAKRELIIRYLHIAIAGSVGDIAWVFRWNRREVASLVESLLNEGHIQEIEVVGLGEMYSLSDCSGGA